MATPASDVSPEPARAPTPPPAPRRRPWKLIAVIVVVIVALSAIAVYVVLYSPKPASVVVYDTNSEMVTLDPSSEFSNSILILPNVYETLTHWNPATNSADPLLALSWNHASDGMTWNFTLRQGVTFHDGTPFNATAVKYSLLRTIGFAQGAAYIWSALGDLTQAEQNIELTGTYAVEFHLLYPAAMDKIASSGYGAYIFSPNTPGANYTLQQAWFNAGHDSGSGPYSINTAQYTSTYSVLDKYANYWGGWQAGQFDHAIIKRVADAIQREKDVTSGAADITEDVPLSDLPTLQNNSAVSVLETPSYRALYAFFNMQKDPTSNLSFRLALAYSLPYDYVAGTVTEGLGTQSVGVIPATMWGHDSTLPHYSFNMAQAAQYLAQSPHPTGHVTLTYTYVTGDPYEQKMAEAWKTQLATLNITLNLQPMEWTAQWALAQGPPSAAQDIFVMYWWPTYVTPYDFLFNMFSYASYQVYNLGYYNNSAFDDSINTAFTEEATSPSTALQDYRTAQLMLYTDLPGMGVVDLKNLYLERANLKGFTDNPAYPLVVFFYQLSR